MALPIYTHIPNLKGLTKIFFKLSRPKENLCGDGSVTILNPKYPRLLSGDTIKCSKFENFNYLNVAFISYKLTMWDLMLFSGGHTTASILEKKTFLVSRRI